MRGRKLRERRTKMLTLKAQGVGISKIVEDFSQEYGLHRQTLWKDWRLREQWVQDVINLDEPSLLNELLQGLKQVIPNAWYEYKTNPNPSVKLGALRLAKETYLDIIQVLQSIGKLERMPTVHEIGLKWLDSENNNNQLQASQGTS